MKTPDKRRPIAALMVSTNGQQWLFGRLLYSGPDGRTIYYPPGWTLEHLINEEVWLLQGALSPYQIFCKARVLDLSHATIPHGGFFDVDVLSPVYLNSMLFWVQSHPQLPVIAEIDVTQKPWLPQCAKKVAGASAKPAVVGGRSSFFRSPIYRRR